MLTVRSLVFLLGLFLVQGCDAVPGGKGAKWAPPARTPTPGAEVLQEGGAEPGPAPLAAAEQAGDAPAASAEPAVEPTSPLSSPVGGLSTFRSQVSGLPDAGTVLADSRQEAFGNLDDGSENPSDHLRRVEAVLAAPRGPGDIDPSNATSQAATGPRSDGFARAMPVGGSDMEAEIARATAASNESTAARAVGTLARGARRVDDPLTSSSSDGSPTPEPEPTSAAAAAPPRAAASILAAQERSAIRRPARAPGAGAPSSGLPVAGGSTAAGVARAQAAPDAGEEAVPPMLAVAIPRGQPSAAQPEAVPADGQGSKDFSSLSFRTTPEGSLASIASLPVSPRGPGFFPVRPAPPALSGEPVRPTEIVAEGTDIFGAHSPEGPHDVPYSRGQSAFTRVANPQQPEDEPGDAGSFQLTGAEASAFARPPMSRAASAFEGSVRFLGEPEEGPAEDLEAQHAGVFARARPVAHPAPAPSGAAAAAPILPAAPRRPSRVSTLRDVVVAARPPLPPLPPSGLVGAPAAAIRRPTVFESGLPAAGLAGAVTRARSTVAARRPSVAGSKPAGPAPRK